MLRESSHSGSSSVTVITNTSVRCFWSQFITSKTPRQRPSLPMTPASSITSLMAVTLASSSGSTPPPGTIQWSGRRDDDTSSTSDSSPRTQIQAALRLKPSSSYILVEFGFSFTIFSRLMQHSHDTRKK